MRRGWGGGVCLIVGCGRERCGVPQEEGARDFVCYDVPAVRDFGGGGVSGRLERHVGWAFVWAELVRV